MAVVSGVGLWGVASAGLRRVLPARVAAVLRGWAGGWAGASC